MTETQRRESGAGDFPTLSQQFDIIRDALDELSIGLEGPFFKLSQGRYRYAGYVVQFSYVFGEASISLTYFGTVNVIDQYVGQNPIVWFLDGPMTPGTLRMMLHKRLDQLGF